jgi:hypothetical protein
MVWPIGTVSAKGVARPHKAWWGVGEASGTTAHPLARTAGEPRGGRQHAEGTLPGRTPGPTVYSLPILSLVRFPSDSNKSRVVVELVTHVVLLLRNYLIHIFGGRSVNFSGILPAQFVVVQKVHLIKFVTTTISKRCQDRSRS